MKMCICELFNKKLNGKYLGRRKQTGFPGRERSAGRRKAQIPVRIRKKMSSGCIV